MAKAFFLSPPPFPPRAKLLVAVSGGGDSLALLHLLLEQLPQAAKRLVVAHVNYGLRGADSLKDEQKAREEALRSGLPFRLLRVRGFKAAVRRNGRSVQDLAREIRYGFFSRLARREKAWGVAVAHQAEDQSETVMDRLLRGAGSRGLSGLRPLQEIPFLKGKPLRIWRPLLHFSGKDLRGYLKSKEISWREDKTNAGPLYRRNQIRSRVIPFLARWNPGISRALCRIGEVAAAEDAYLESLLGRVEKEVQGRWAGLSFRCSAGKFAKLPLALKRRWVRRVAERLNPAARGLSFEREEEILRLWEAGEKGPRDMGFQLTAGRKGTMAFLQRRNS
jgi:tRNA(Ile)-lysidine synthase